MNTIRTWSMCAVVIVAFALLAVPVQSVVQAQDNQFAVSTAPSNTFYNPPACTLYGRQCNPNVPTCCPGSSCVFHGGSTRVGYACMPRKNTAMNLSLELSDNKLERRAVD